MPTLFDDRFDYTRTRLFVNGCYFYFKLCRLKLTNLICS